MILRVVRHHAALTFFCVCVCACLRVCMKALMEAGGMRGSALIPRKAPTMPKPQWHSPWKLYRVRRRKGGKRMGVRLRGRES